MIASSSQADAQSILGTAESFGVLGGAAVTNTGPSTIHGDVGVSPGSSITGFPPGIVGPSETIHQTDAVAQQAQSDNTTAYNVLRKRCLRPYFYSPRRANAAKEWHRDASNF